MQGGDLVAEGGVAEVPGERGRPGSGVLELDAFPLAELVRAVDGDVGVEFAKFEFEDPHVAVGRGVVRAPGARRGGEIVHPSASGADTLVDRAVLVKSGGAAVDVLVGEGTAEEGRIDEIRGVGSEHGEVEVAAVGAGLKGPAGGGQAEGGTAGDIGCPAVGIGLTAPSTDVDLFAFAHQEGRRAEVDLAASRTQCGLPFDVAEVGQEAGDVLSAGGLRVDIPEDGHASPSLSVSVGATLTIALDEVDLVIVVEAMVGGELDCEVIRTRIHLGDPALHFAER